MPLNWACLKNHFEVIKYLIQKGAKITNQALKVVVANKAQEIFNYLVQNGADVQSFVEYLEELKQNSIPYQDDEEEDEEY